MLFVKSQTTDMSVLAQFLQSVPSKKSKGWIFLNSGKLTDRLETHIVRNDCGCITNNSCITRFNTDLFCLELLLHQLRDHSAVTPFHWRWHINVLHVFGLENILHSCRENDSQTFVIQLGCFCCFPDPNQPALVYVPMFLVYCLLFFLSGYYIALLIIVHGGKAAERQETRLLKWLTSENIKLHSESEDVWAINLTT